MPRNVKNISNSPMGIFWETKAMEQLHILRCQVWKSHLCPKWPIIVQGFKEALRSLANLDTNEISRPVFEYFSRVSPNNYET
jgi:hypothetical protein